MEPIEMIPIYGQHLCHFHKNEYLGNALRLRRLVTGLKRGDRGSVQWLGN